MGRQPCEQTGQHGMTRVRPGALVVLHDLGTCEVRARSSLFLEDVMCVLRKAEDHMLPACGRSFFPLSTSAGTSTCLSREAASAIQRSRAPGSEQKQHPTESHAASDGRATGVQRPAGRRSRSGSLPQDPKGPAARRQVVALRTAWTAGLTARAPAGTIVKQ